MMTFTVPTHFTLNKFEKAILHNSAHRILHGTPLSSLRLRKILLSIDNLKESVHFYVSMWLRIELPKIDIQNNLIII